MVAPRHGKASTIGTKQGLFLLFIITVSLIASGSVYLWPKSLGTGYFLGDQVDHYLDMEGTAGIREMLAKGSAFEASGGKLVNRGVQGGPQTALWLRFQVPSLPGSPQHDWTLSLQETRVREVRLYIESNLGNYRERVIRPGLRDPISGLVPRFASFDFEAAEISGKTIWLRVYTRSSKRALLWLESRETFVGGELRQTLMFGILTGVLVALFCYLLALGTILKEGSLSLLAIFVVFFCAYVVSDRAFVESLLLPGALRVSRLMSISSTLGCYAAWTAFLLSYLRTRTHFYKLYIIGVMSILIALIFSIAAVFEAANDTYNLRQIMPFFGIGIVILGATVAAVSYRYEPSRVLAFAACWSPAIIAVLSRLMLDANPSGGGSVAAVYSIYAAAAFSVLCFAIILSLDLQDREQRLRLSAEQQEARFRSFAHSASDGFWETDRSGHLVSLTGPITGLLGEPGRPFMDALSGLGVNQEGLWRLKDALAGQQPFRAIEMALMPSADQPISVEISGEPFWQGTVFGGFRGILTDITERKQRQAGEVRQQRMAAIGQLASGIAHEINSLLHPIINLSRRVKDHQALDDAGKRALDIVLASGDRAKSILANLLASAHPTRTKQSNAPLFQAVADICDEIEPLVSSQVTLTVHIDGRDGPLVGKSEVYQLLSNLVANAVHAMPGQGELSIEGTRDALGNFQITVTDAGQGMSEEIAAKIFEPFFTTKPIGQGTGLGLATVAAIVKAWNGRVQVETAPQKGTRVTIVIPHGGPLTADRIDASLSSSS